MARARFIRPEFFTDEKLSELPIAARMLYAGIWCQSDLRGVFECSPKLLRVQVFPFDDATTTALVGEWLDMLKSHGFIATFEAEGKVYGYVVKWTKHQTISGRETQVGSKRPPPPIVHGVVHVNDPSMVQDPTRAATPTLTSTLTSASACHADTPAPIDPKKENRRKLEKELRSHGMAWKDDAFLEWKDLLVGTGVCTTFEWCRETLAHIAKSSRKQGSLAAYARQALPYLDAAVAHVVKLQEQEHEESLGRNQPPSDASPDSHSSVDNPARSA